MEDKMQSQNEVSLLDIVKLLLRKIKWIILSVLICAVLGGVLGYVRTKDTVYYGTNLLFYVNPDDAIADSNINSEQGVYGSYKEPVMASIITLLSSDRFAEMLILGENGLPTEDQVNAVLNSTSENVTQAMKDDMVEKIAIAEPKIQAYEEAKVAIAEALQDLVNKTEVVSNANEELQGAWKNARNSYSQLPSNPTKDITVFTMAGVPDELREDIFAKFDALEDAQEEQKIANTTYNNQKENLKTLKDEALDSRTDALESWRTANESYASTINTILGATSYTSLAPGQSADTSANCFIYVTITVLNNLEFANDLRSYILDVLPDYIEETMPIPSGYGSTSCTRWTTTDQIAITNAGYTESSIVKYGLILAAVALIITSLIIILLDRTDKRLRDVDQIAELFKLPVLGVIPTITKKEKTSSVDDSTIAVTEEKAVEENSTEVTE